MQDFNIQFENILCRIPMDIKPKDTSILLHYLNAFEETFGFILKEKQLSSLRDAHNKAKIMEINVFFNWKCRLIRIL